jgi:hypothetical protein
MGAYAAILFGDLIDADAVVALDPEVEIGCVTFRSFLWNKIKRFDARYVSIVNSLRRLGSRTLLSLSAFDPMEAATILKVLDLSGTKIIYSKSFHGDARHFDWQSLFREPREPACSFVISNFIATNVEPDALLAAASLYIDCCNRTAVGGDEKYQRARDAFPTVHLYDAILYCLAGARKEASFAMALFLEWRQQLPALIYPDPLYDIGCRFSVDGEAEASTRRYLEMLMPNPRGI